MFPILLAALQDIIMFILACGAKSKSVIQPHANETTQDVKLGTHYRSCKLHLKQGKEPPLRWGCASRRFLRQPRLPSIKEQYQVRCCFPILINLLGWLALFQLELTLGRFIGAVKLHGGLRQPGARQQLLQSQREIQSVGEEKSIVSSNCSILGFFVGMPAFQPATVTVLLITT